MKDGFRGHLSWNVPFCIQFAISGATATYQVLIADAFFRIIDYGCFYVSVLLFILFPKGVLNIGSVL